MARHRASPIGSAAVFGGDDGPLEDERRVPEVHPVLGHVLPALAFIPFHPHATVYIAVDTVVMCRSFGSG
jgi:hypothetical protein